MTRAVDRLPVRIERETCAAVRATGTVNRPSPQPSSITSGGNMLDPVPLTQVLVRQLIHFCDVAHRDIAHRRPEIAHSLASR